MKSNYPIVSIIDKWGSDFSPSVKTDNAMDSILFTGFKQAFVELPKLSSADFTAFT